MTITEGTNRLCPITKTGIVGNWREIIGNRDNYRARMPKFWDGSATERIAKIIASTY